MRRQRYISRLTVLLTLAALAGGACQMTWAIPQARAGTLEMTACSGYGDGAADTDVSGMVWVGAPPRRPSRFSSRTAAALWRRVANRPARPADEPTRRSQPTARDPAPRTGILRSSAAQPPEVRTKAAVLKADARRPSSFSPQSDPAARPPSRQNTPMSSTQIEQDAAIRGIALCEHADKQIKCNDWKVVA